MKLLQSLTQIIIESKVDDIYAKYYRNIPRTIFDNIVMADPKSKAENGNVVFMGKYAKILLNIYKIGNMPNLENLVEATRYLDIIYNKNLAVDLNKIKQISDLHPIVKDYLVTGDTPIRTILSELPKETYQLLHNGEKWLVFRPKTEKAASWLGVGSAWCTSWGKYTLTPAYKGRVNRFSQYNYAPIYIMIDKNDEKHKFQFQFDKKEYRDVVDGMINIQRFFQTHKELRDFFFPLLISRNENSIFSDEEQYKRIDALPDTFASIIQRYNIEDLLEMGIENKVALSFASNKDLEELMADGSISDTKIESISYEGSNIIFEMNSECSNSRYDDINQAYDYIRHLESNSSDPNLYETMRDEIMDEDSGILDKLIDSYFEKNKSYVPFIKFNIPTLEAFVSMFKEVITTNEEYKDKILESYLEKSVDLTTPVYIGVVESTLNDVREYFNISKEYYAKGMTLSANAVEFIKYIDNKNKPQISDFCYVFSDYIDNSGVDYYEYYVEYNDVYPDNKEMFSVIEEVIDEFISNNFDEFDESKSELVAARHKLTDLLSKHFTENNQPNRNEYPFKFKNSLVEIYANNIIDEKDLTTRVYLIDLATKEKYFGSIKVDNLHTYMFNYKLELITNNDDDDLIKTK